jgi:hypothetical protein
VFAVLGDRTNYPFIESGDYLNTTSYIGIPAGLTSTPDQYVEAGVVVAGGGLSMQVGLGKTAPFFTPKITQVSGNTIAGQTYGADLFRSRETQSIEFICTLDECQFLLDAIGWRRGTSGAFYLVLDPNLGNAYQTFSSAWVTLVSVGPPLNIEATDDGKRLYSVTMQFSEKL